MRAVKSTRTLTNGANRRASCQGSDLSHAANINMPILLSWQPEIGWEEKRLWRKVRRRNSLDNKTETWRHFPGVKNEEMRRTERFTRLKLPDGFEIWSEFGGLAGFVRLRFLGGVLGQGYTWALLMGLLWLPIIGNRCSLQLINSIQF